MIEVDWKAKLLFNLRECG